MSEVTQNNEPSGEVVVYEAPDGGPRVEVVVGDETVWLTSRQMSELFQTTTRNVELHAENAYAEGELDEGTTAKESFVVRSEGDRQVRRRIRHYNLDMVISVGYRVKSRRGTQFRIWANGVLRDHLLRGYTLNEKRLLARGVEFDQAVALLTTTLRKHEALTPEGQAVLDVVQHYARTWRMLRAYDEDQLSSAPGQTSAPIASLDLATARETIRTLRDDMVARGENPGMFGQERGDALESILLSIEQTWGGEALYPTIESRAALLRDQESPAHRREQADGLAVVSRLPAPEQRPGRIHGAAAVLGHGARRPGPARGRERGVAQGPRDPPDPQPVGRGSPVVADLVRPVLRPLDRTAPGEDGVPRISS
jgi:hypothetical protein